MSGTCPALTAATVPTNAAESVGGLGWGVSVVVEAAAPGTEVVGSGVEEGTGTPRFVGPVPFVGDAARGAAPGELEHEASSPQDRRKVRNTAARWRPGHGTDAHHSPRSVASARAVVVAALVSVLAACSGPAHDAGTRHRVAPLATSSTTVVPTTAVPATTVPTTAVATAVPTTAVATTVAPARRVEPTAPVTTAPHPTPAPPLLVTRLVGVGSATQVIAVSASGYGQSVATFTAYQDDATGWHQVFGPWQANVGYAGFAPPGQKHEGDGRTPSGSFGFDFFFGVLADPGVQFPYRVVTGPDIVWDDDPSSPLYNQWVDTSTSDAGAAPEPMDEKPAYDYGAVIAYNTSPTVPGAGSAIFLHVSSGGATVGCVALPTDELLAVLRWLSPAAQPRIIMGTAATIAP